MAAALRALIAFHLALLRRAKVSGVHVSSDPTLQILLKSEEITT